MVLWKKYCDLIFTFLQYANKHEFAMEKYSADIIEIAGILPLLCWHKLAQSSHARIAGYHTRLVSPRPIFYTNTFNDCIIYNPTFKIGQWPAFKIKYKFIIKKNNALQISPKIFGYITYVYIIMH